MYECIQTYDSLKKAFETSFVCMCHASQAVALMWANKGNESELFVLCLIYLLCVGGMGNGFLEILLKSFHL